MDTEMNIFVEWEVSCLNIWYSCMELISAWASDSINYVNL